MKTYYHFTGDTLRDGRPIPKPGVWLKHDGPIVPCASGLHASEHPFDALAYAPGNMLHKVNLRGEITPHGDPIDKHCARERRIVATIDAEWVLRRFARKVVLDVVKQYWHDAPGVVIEYLATGNETLRAAAWAAARDAAWAAARAAARDAAWAAARAAARDAAWAAARDAARAAARAAARDAARDAARAAAWAAARDAARAAARAAARDAAWAAAWDAARDAATEKYRGWFKEIVEEEFNKSAAMKEKP